MSKIAFTVFAPGTDVFISFLHRSEDLSYTAAHRGTLDHPAGEMDAAACVAVLDRLFADGNGMGSGAGFTVGGRSMSVGDVVALDGCGTWLCDSIGWRQLEEAEAARFQLDAETCPPRVVDEEVLVREYQPAFPLRNGLMVYVRRSDVGRVDPEAAVVTVAGECRITGDFFVLENVPMVGLCAWYDEGVAIQDALPGLSPMEREFIKSAIRPGAFAPA